MRIARAGFKPYFWRNDKGTNEVDFIINLGGRLIPVEVKSGDNVGSASLKECVQLFQPAGAQRRVRAAKDVKQPQSFGFTAVWGVLYATGRSCAVSGRFWLNHTTEILEKQGLFASMSPNSLLYCYFFKNADFGAFFARLQEIGKKMARKISVVYTRIFACRVSCRQDNGKKKARRFWIRSHGEEQKC